MVNPRISRDGKYPQNLENWEILGNTLSKKRSTTFLLFFSVKRLFLNLIGFIMLLFPLRFVIK